MLWKFFRDFGIVVDAYIPPHQRHRSKFAFVRFRTNEEANRAIMLRNGGCILYKSIRVFNAESSKDDRVPNDQNSGHHIGSFRPHEAKTDGRLFKDVVVGDHNPPVSNKQLSCAEVGKSPNGCLVECDSNTEKTTSNGGPLKEVSLDFALPQANMNWLKRSVVGRLRSNV
ncbi:hypothetical protein CCACVL1_27507 [Corchorus capsularis]|uniref:RRM domain-containing protein n=1 Tax=Corchorus capsularis TaxID=210143 RepID=A0A1R3GA36_COCAP|nr:hypothetical protein CCACVL1_27507 [Corchorus capsularis]